MVNEALNREPQVEAAWRVLSEIADILLPLGDRAVLLGGWIPYLLYGSQHIGSTDVDWALDLDRIRPEENRRIAESLTQRGYERSRSRPFTWTREVKWHVGESVVVEVDFLSASEKHGLSGSIETLAVRGCDIALRDHQPFRVRGRFPDGRASNVEIALTTQTAFIVTKGIAIMDRTDPKDPYDIYFCIRHHPDGPRVFGRQFRSILNQSLVLEALSKIRYIFRSPESEGPKDVVGVLNLAEPDERARVRRDAFEQVSAFLNAAGVP